MRAMSATRSDIQEQGLLALLPPGWRPYAKLAFSREWRVVARAAGIPDHIKNMMARAGAITEAEDAGADLDEIRSAVGHANAAMTARYSRGAMGKQRSVQSKRVALRTRIDED